MRLQLIGTGTAFHTDGRGSSSLLVAPDGAPPFLVDLGPSAVAALERLAVDYAAIDRLFVTHLHGDHTAGWPFLRLNLTFGQGRERPFDVHGPRGVRDCLEGLCRLCYGELLTASPRFAVRYHELEVAPASDLRAGAVGFDVVPMDHHPTSIGYRFVAAGRSVGVTGDTRWCEGLERLARESDLLVMECTTVAKSDQPHVSLEELRAGIDRLGGCRVVLVHLTDAVSVSLAADPIPRVLAGHDGLTLEVGSRAGRGG